MIGTKKILATIILFFTVFCTEAQQLKLNNVSLEEMQEKFYPTDSTAVAAFLFKKGETYFEVDFFGRHIVVYEVEAKIKIYKKEGLSYANFEIPYSPYYSNVEVEEAHSFTLKDDKIVKRKVKKEGIFNETNDGRNVKKVLFPNIQEGSIIEIKYIIKTYRTVYVDDWFFQDKIPTKVSSYQFMNPSYLVYSYTVTPNGIDITSSQKIKKKIRKAGVGGSVRFEESWLNMIATDIPAFKEELHMGNSYNYIASVKHELVKQKINDKKQTKLATSWRDVAQLLYQDDDFGQQINNKNYLPEPLKTSLNETNLTEIQKIDTIFSYVKHNIKWNKYTRGIYCSSSGLDSVAISKSGNFAEMNLYLVVMLRNAGFKANPVVLGTRNNGFILEPNLSSLNCVIAGVELDNSIILLDATNPNSTIRVRPFWTINHTGWLLRDDYSFQEVNLTPDYKSKNIVYGTITVDKQGDVTGKMKQIFQDYYSLSLASTYDTENDEEKRIAYLENQLTIKIDNYKKSTTNDIYKTITEELDFQKTAYCDIAQGKIYFSPFLFLGEKTNPFTEEIRNYPIDFVFPFQKRYVLIVEFPENYTLEYAPENLNISIDDGIGSYKFESSFNQNKLTVIGEFNLNHPAFSKDYYNSLRAFYKKMFDKQHEKFILTNY